MVHSLKYLICFLLMINLSVVLSQSTVRFQEKGLQSALAQAKLENKPVLLLCYTTWCPHCKLMKEEVFTEKTVAEYFNKTYICAAQDMEKPEVVDLNKEVKINSYPTFIFYDSNGTIIYRIEGEFKPALFITEGEKALIKQKQLPYLKEQFEQDVTNSNNCYDYLRALKKGGMDFSAVVNQYFATQTDKQLLSEVNWRIFTNGISDINSREYQFVIEHQKEFSNIASPERVKRKFKYDVKALLMPLVETTDTINYAIKREIAAQIHSFVSDSLIFTFDLTIYETTHNWKAYSRTCLQSAQTFVWHNHTQLTDIANIFLKNISDNKALSQAADWAERSLALDKSYDNYLLCARLYQKLNNLATATKMAESAAQMAKQSGWEGTEAEQLLKQMNVLNK